MRFRSPDGQKGLGGNPDDCCFDWKCRLDLPLAYWSIMKWEHDKSAFYTDELRGTEAECRHGTQWIVAGMVSPAWKRLPRGTPPPPSSDDWVGPPTIEQLAEQAIEEVGP